MIQIALGIVVGFLFLAIIALIVGVSVLYITKKKDVDTLNHYDIDDWFKEDK